MNVELLNQVVKFHEEVPARFDMDDWYEALEPGRASDSLLEPAPACGIVGCIAGTANILGGKLHHYTNYDLNIEIYDEPEEGWFKGGQAALELTKEQAQRLFYHTSTIAGYWNSKNSWPSNYSLAYLNATTQAERVAALKARVAHFIATDGQE